MIALIVVLIVIAILAIAVIVLYNLSLIHISEPTRH